MNINDRLRRMMNERKKKDVAELVDGAKGTKERNRKMIRRAK